MAVIYVNDNMCLARDKHATLIERAVRKSLLDYAQMKRHLALDELLLCHTRRKLASLNTGEYRRWTHELFHLLCIYVPAYDLLRLSFMNGWTV